MKEFLDKEFYGNTVSAWAISLLIIFGSFIIAKVIYWVSKNIIKKLTAKTKSKLDDLIVDKVEEPVVMAVVIAGFWYGFHFLSMSPWWTDFWNNAFYVAITFDVTWMLVRLVDAIILEYLSPLVEKTDGDLDDQLLPIVRKSLKTIIWIIGIVIGLNNAGYDVGALVAGLGLGGLAFAMAAKDSVANLFGGATVFMDKPFKIGDRIQIDGYDGTILEIGMRSTRLKTLAGRIVTIPNKNFTDKFIENVSVEPSRKVPMTLGLTYDMTEKDVQKAIDILGEIAAELKDHLEEKYVAIFESFGDFSLNVLFVYYIKGGEDNYAVMSKINFEILKRFNAAKIEFAFPTQTIVTQQG